MAFAPLLIAGAGLAFSGYQAVEQKKIGMIQQAQLKVQAKTEAVSANQQQIDRRRALIKALSSQNAAAGAGGIETSGSVEAIARRDIRDSQNDLLIGDMNASTRQGALRAQAGNARRLGNVNAGASLLDAANYGVKAYESMPKKKAL